MPKKIFTAQEKEHIIYEYTVNKVGAKTLGTQYGCSAPTLLKNLKEWGITPNSRKLDLSNQIFGKLTVLKPAAPRDDRYTRWVCQCACGNTTEVRTDFLTNGHTLSCGCLKEQCFNQLDLINQRFGKLTVISNYPPDSKKCLCDCGNTIIVKTYNLTSGNTQSCGCLKSKGELKLNTLLTQLQIPFKTQFSFDDCRFPDTNRLAFFDYAIFDENNNLLCLMEYNGIQHEIGWDNKPESLYEIQQRDQYKQEYCNNKQIPLIQINYTDYNNLNEQYIRNLLNK